MPHQCLFSGSRFWQEPSVSQTEFAVNFFVALFALIDPIGNVPVFAAATSQGAPRARRMVAVYIGLFVMGFLATIWFTGISLLQFFGISLPAFRIAGGVILFLLGLDMARNDFAAMFEDLESETGDHRGYARRSFERLIVPFAMPLLIGPGAISTVIIYASEAKSMGAEGQVSGLVAIVGVAVSVIASFWATPVISRLLGRIGMTIVVRVLGLILCAMAVQFILVGIGDATGGLILQSTSKPYGP
jgi:multiple antibiotic resistance protein